MFKIALKRSQFQNVTDNRMYRKNFTKDKAENKKEILNNNINTISIVGRTELEDVRVYSDEKSDIEKSIVDVGITVQLISSGNINSSEEMIMSVENINACRTEGHGNIDHGVDAMWVRKLFLIISKVLIIGRKKIKRMFLYHSKILL